MVSEDSDQLSPGLPAIHRLNDFRDLRKTRIGLVETGVDQSDAANKLHLIAGFVAFPARTAWLPDETDGEAALSVYKANDPASLNQSFLLISCTRHIVTVPPTWDDTRSAGYSGVPAYGQMLTTRLPVWRAAIYLRHFCYIPNRDG